VLNQIGLRLSWNASPQFRCAECSY